MRNGSINCIKAFACMFVVFVHARFPSYMGQVFSALSRTAVMFFFVVSGYFSYGEDMHKVHVKMIKNAKKIGKLFVFSLLFYFVWEMLLISVRDGLDAVFLWIESLFTVEKTVKLLFLNKIPFAEPLWFLPALLYCYLLWAVVSRFGHKRIVEIIAWLLLILNVVCQIIWVLCGINIDDTVFRSVWFYGFPVFVISNRLHFRVKNSDYKVQSDKLLWWFVAGTGFVLFERFFIGNHEFYVGTIIAAYCIFLYAVQNPYAITNNVIRNIGEKLSMYVYIVHWMVMSVVLKMATIFGMERETAFLWSYPLWVVVCSLIISYGLYTLFSRTRRRGSDT